MALNFGLLGDAGAPAMGYIQGQQDVARNQLAQQQIQTGQLNQQKAQMEMEAFKRRQAGLDQFMNKAKELGVNGDPEQLTQAYWEHAISTGDPNEIKAAMIAVQTAKERKAYMGNQPPTTGAVATPVPMTNNLGTALPPAGAPAPANAMATAPAPVNAMATPPAGNRLFQIENRMAELRRFPNLPEAKQEHAELIKERDRLMTPHVVGDNLVTLGGGVNYTAPAKSKQTDLQLNYQAAKDQGFVGSIFDYERKLKEAGRPPAAPRPEPAPSITTIIDPTDPTKMIAIDARVYKGGGVGSPGVIGVGGKEPGAALREGKSESGKTQLADDLDNLRSSFTRLNEMRAIPSTERNVASNLMSAAGASGIGQAFGKAGGSPEQVERDVINSARQRLITSIKNATGMSARSLDSNVELKTMLNSISDPGQSYEAAIRIIDDIENAYVKGKPKVPVKPSGGGAPPPPPGFKPD
jgi:hypothetical protein